MKINIHISTYIFLLIAFLSGYFEYMYLFLISIFVHEYGHFLFGLLVGYNNTIINIYPFGGITIFNTELNTPLYKEFISLIGGLIFQIIFMFLIYKLYNYGLITNHVYIIINRINFILISFNFMLITPLDGGRLLNIILQLFLPYKLSNIICIIVSSIFVIIFLISSISLFRILLCLFLIKNIIFEVINLENKYYSFLYERYINKYNFKRIVFINNINYFKRDCIHFINNVYERNYLSKLFDKRTENMLKY